MVRSVTVFDEDYTEEDMAAALEWQTEDALKCVCGQPVDESMAPGRDDAYDASVLVCHACAARDRAMNAFRSQGSPDMAGIKTSLSITD